MPIYEYECGSCGHRYEKMVRIGAEAPACPECSGSDVRKLVSQSSFILKGGGWYKDHYGLKKDGAGSSGKESTAKASEAKTESKSESKPAAAPSAPAAPAKA